MQPIVATGPATTPRKTAKALSVSPTRFRRLSALYRSLIRDSSNSHPASHAKIKAKTSTRAR